MKVLLVKLLFVVIGFVNSQHRPWEGIPTMPNSTHTCRMWGECYPVNGFMQKCAYSGAPLQFLHDRLSPETRDEMLSILENRCPELLYDESGNRKPDDEIYTCCSSEQVTGMAESMLLADSVLGRCPACLRNYVRQICEMNCSPEQSRFITVYNETAPDLTVYVTEIDYYMHEDFMVESHASCSGVLVPQTGMPAINLMCGSVAVCDAESWYGFAGDIEANPFAPTQVNIIRWSVAEESMNAVALACNETFEGDLPCSCVDCTDTCPAGSEPVVHDICTVMSVNCIGFSVGLIFFLISVTTFIALTFIDNKKMRNSKTSSKPTNIEAMKINKLNKLFQKIFGKIGSVSSGYPMVIIWLTSCVAFGMYFGIMKLKITSNPIEIWSHPDSRSRQDFNYFNSRFGPFYRASQVFLTFRGLDTFQVGNITYGPAFRIEALEELVRLEERIMAIGRGDGGTVLENVCFSPMRSSGSETNLDLCVYMSASTYLGDEKYDINNGTYLTKILNCFNNYLSLDCQASWGGGAEPEISFGGYDGNDIQLADTLVTNFPLSNYLTQKELEPVLEWEQRFLDLMQDYEENLKPDYIEIAYGAERSIEDEIQRVSQAEIVPISASYILMFVYVTLALGKVKSFKSFLYGSRVLVALGSILIELIAIYCALGTMGFLGVSTTLLSINVIPFFVLSVGIDNVFLMVNTLYDIQNNLKQYDDYNENMTPEKKRRYIFAKMLSRMGPSIFDTSSIQITCFALGVMAKFPAVQSFAIFATFSLIYLFILQMTTVIAILALDYNRELHNRLDIFFCIQRKMLDDSDPLKSDEPYRSITQRLMKPYGKFILDWRTKIAVFIIFMAILSISVILTPQLEIGLDQQLALPRDSYVYHYLGAVNNLLKLGPPVYFILKGGLNFTNIDHQNVVCGGRLCNSDSLITQIFLASRYSEITHIARSSNSWIDDFFDWSSLTGSCCKYNIEDGNFCQSKNESSVCASCDVGMDENRVRPTREAFEKYIPFFLQDEPTDLCNKGGLASYLANVNYILDDEGRATVHDTNFMAYHIALDTSKEYITAVKYGYEISDSITASIRSHTGLDVEVVPYSVFYPFYEQYLTMWSETMMSIGLSLLGVLVITLLTSGFNFLTTAAIMFMTISVVLDMMGVMYVWNIPLNAVSCINLIVAIGISVEFCNHIAYAFATSICPPRERVADALSKVGSTIITGITLTNIPIIVLAFSYTDIIEVFFFRMFFSLVVIGFFHGMVLLPIVLSFLSNVTEKS